MGGEVIVALLAADRDGSQRRLLGVVEPPGGLEDVRRAAQDRGGPVGVCRVEVRERTLERYSRRAAAERLAQVLDEATRA